MQRILNAIRNDLDNKNYYAALYVGLSLIDACSKIEFPEMKGNHKRYTNWLEKYYIPLYEPYIDEQIFPGNAIYQLRCSVLHESTNYINENDRKKYKDIENLYQIIITNSSSHRNKATVSNGENTIDEIQINIVMFINEIIKSIQQWMSVKNPNDFKLKFSIDLEKWSSTELNGSYGFKDCS
jgi:hypothetical protein